MFLLGERTMYNNVCLVDPDLTGIDVWYRTVKSCGGPSPTTPIIVNPSHIEAQVLATDTSATATVEVTGTGTIRVQDHSSFISVTPASGPSGTHFSGTVNPSTLGVGVHTGTVTFTDDTGGEKTVTLRITVRATGGTLTPSPSQLEATITQGFGVTPQVLTVSSSIAGEVITATPNDPGVQVTSTGLNSWTVGLPSANILGVGVYERSIKLQGNQGSSGVVMLKLTVLAPAPALRPLGAKAYHIIDNLLRANYLSGITESYHHVGGITGRTAIVLAQTNVGGGNAVEMFADTVPVKSSQLILATLDVNPPTSAFVNRTWTHTIDEVSAALTMDHDISAGNTIAYYYEAENGSVTNPTYIKVMPLTHKTYAASELQETAWAVEYYVNGVQARVKVAGQSGDHARVTIVFSNNGSSLLDVTYIGG
jgi:hypothetical protein